MSVYRPVFERLNRAQVRYVVVGGLAMVLHGRARFTADVDLVLDLSTAQATAAVAVLEGLGLRPRLPVPASGFIDPATRQRWIEEKGMDVFTFWDPSNPLLVVDLFVRPPIDFGRLWAGSSGKKFLGLEVRTASIGHLLEMKKKADRPVDREDVRFLNSLVKSGGECE